MLEQARRRAAAYAGFDAQPDYRRAKKRFPAINVEKGIEWSGMRPSLPDSLPCLGEAPEHKNLFSAFGHSHYGFGKAPNTGPIVAELVSGQSTNLDLSPYRIDRFS